MTQDELDAIPIHELIGKRLLREENGIKIYIPVFQPLDLSFVSEDDLMCAWDREGQCWMFGTKDGVRVRYRNAMLDH